MSVHNYICTLCVGLKTKKLIVTWESIIHKERSIKGVSSMFSIISQLLDFVVYFL